MGIKNVNGRTQKTTYVPLWGIFICYCNATVCKEMFIGPLFQSLIMFVVLIEYPKGLCNTPSNIFEENSPKDKVMLPNQDSKINLYSSYYRQESF